MPCPIERAFGSVVSEGGCCIAVRRPMVSMRGEWHHRHRGKMILLGGHAIGIVGFNDEYTDEWGNTGGFIIRNSWSDGLEKAHGSAGRGSHSAAYFMRDMDDADEALACPNPHSPRSWSVCKSLGDCRNPLTAFEAEALRRPLTLTCIDNAADLFDVCTKNGTYFMTNLTEWDEDGLFVACFLWGGREGRAGPRGRVRAADAHRRPRVDLDARDHRALQRPRPLRLQLHPVVRSARLKPLVKTACAYLLPPPPPTPCSAQRSPR